MLEIAMVERKEERTTIMLEGNEKMERKSVGNK
jgi:hypothetical protein